MEFRGQRRAGCGSGDSRAPASDGQCECHAEPLPDLLPRLDLALVCSGTASLEAALAGVPHESSTAPAPSTTSWAGAWSGRPHIGLSNLVCGSEMVREHVQDAAAPLPLARSLLRWLARPAERQDFYGMCAGCASSAAEPGVLGPHRRRASSALLGERPGRIEMAVQGLKLALAPLALAHPAPATGGLEPVGPSGCRTPAPASSPACTGTSCRPSATSDRARPALLVSNSPDGEILVRTLGGQDYGFVRGGTGEDGGRAFVRLARQLDAGHSVGLAVDGPEGPYGAIQTGVLQLARLDGCSDRAPAWPGAARPVRAEHLGPDRGALSFHPGRHAPRARSASGAGRAARGPGQCRRQTLADFFGVEEEGRMKILDLRPRSVRQRPWEGARPRRLAGESAARLGRLWAGRGRSLHGRAGGAGGRPPPAAIVVSVGNLALGGTGKTPVVMALARDLAGPGRRGAVLTRGYGSPLARSARGRRRERTAGDEARLHGRGLADTAWPVVQARRPSRDWTSCWRTRSRTWRWSCWRTGTRPPVWAATWTC